MQKTARFIDFETNQLRQIFEPYDNVGSDPSIFFALRHALFDEVASGKSPPTLWVHNSFGPNGILSIGKNETPTRVDFASCRELGVPVYVRKSGGWHIYNDSNFVFVNVYIPMQDIGMLEEIKYRTDTTGGFKLNSRLSAEALRQAGVNVGLHPTDPSSLLTDDNGKLIGMNSARLTNDIVYLEGGIRYSDTDLEKASRVFKMSKEERQDMMGCNTAVTQYNRNVSLGDFKYMVSNVYKTMGGFEKYHWQNMSLSQREIELAAKYAKEFISLTERSDDDLQKIGEHEGKICILHWLDKYGPYCAGAY